VSGTALRYPSRLLVDPHQRAFAKTTPSLGGIVVVDQSGSMDLDHDEIDSLLARTPGATILGYSHRPGDLQGQVNAWVIARRGRRRSDVPTGNVGNGVDGPALRWALDQRQRGERVIWVTDGQVTDSNDHPQRALAGECAELVLRHRIVLVRTLAQAGDVLARRRYRSCESPEGFGRVGREIAQIWSVTRTS